MQLPIFLWVWIMFTLKHDTEHLSADQITVTVLKSSYELARVHIHLTAYKLWLTFVFVRSCLLELTCTITAGTLRGSAHMHICCSVYILPNVGQRRILWSAAAGPGISNLTFNSPKGKWEAEVGSAGCILLPNEKGLLRTEGCILCRMLEQKK